MKRTFFVYRLWLLMMVALVSTLSLSAQEVQPRPASDFPDLQQGVTEAELVTRALASNPALAAQRQQIEMAKGGVEIIPPHQSHHTTAEPDAFRVAGGAVDGLGGFDEFVGLALAVLGGIGGIGGGFTRRVLGGRIAALGGGASDTDQDGNPGNGEAAQNQVLKLKHPSTHAFPDLLPARGRSWRAGLMPFK